MTELTQGDADGEEETPRMSRSEANTYLARQAYAHGHQPLDYAIGEVWCYLSQRTSTIVFDTLCDPTTEPGFLLAQSPGCRKILRYLLDAFDDKVLANKIVGCLLDLGWTPPDLGDSRQEVA